jgi:drug/metabolite transporter (DMT)-like permease
LFISKFGWWTFPNFYLKVSLTENTSNHSSLAGELETQSGSFNFGYVLAFVAPMLFSCSAIMTKELALRKVHFSIVSVWVASFGVPATLAVVVYQTVSGQRDLSLVGDTSFVYEVIFFLVAGVSGMYSFRLLSFMDNESQLFKSSKVSFILLTTLTIVQKFKSFIYLFDNPNNCSKV